MMAESATADKLEARTLSIVIPALDEVEVIGSTIQRCLDARAAICSLPRIQHVEIIVVSDGSSDRTEEIARGFEEVTVLAFDRNKGYGAAIKCGFEHARGELLAFLDADGTCDPLVFVYLCRTLDRENADLALGSRMGSESGMPAIRRIGNSLFAWMLGLLSRRRVVDTASGMRVIKRDCLPQLLPLPDGLHFTPAMSAKVLLEDRLKLVEVPMPYAVRVGRSKLSVIRDGVRFFNVILRGAVCFRPARPLLALALMFSILAMVVAMMPILFFVTYGRLMEWMIYRVMLSSLLGTIVILLVSGAAVAERIAASAFGRQSARAGATGAVVGLLGSSARRFLGLGCVAGAVVSSMPGIVQYASTGHVDMHWSRVVLSSLLVVVAGILALTGFLYGMLDLINVEQALAPRAPQPDRVRSGQARNPQARKRDASAL